MLSTAIETLPNGHHIRVSRLSHGEPLIFLHGYPENLQIWAQLLPQLSNQFQTIAFDWPGMGYSDDWKGGTTPTHMAERLLVIMDAWKLDKATIIGTDMGGQPALVFAAKYPRRVRRLVVMNCLAFAEEDTSWEIKILRKYGWNKLIIRKIPSLVFKRAEHTSLPTGTALTPVARKDMWDAFNQIKVREFVSRLCAGYQGTLHQLPVLYTQIVCPTLILWGGQDKHFPPSQGLRLHKTIGGSLLQILPTGHHWMVWDLADDVAKHISDFIADTP